VPLIRPPLPASLATAGYTVHDLACMPSKQLATYICRLGVYPWNPDTQTWITLDQWTKVAPFDGSRYQYPFDSANLPAGSVAWSAGAQQNCVDAATTSIDSAVSTSWWLGFAMCPTRSASAGANAALHSYTRAAWIHLCCLLWYHIGTCWIFAKLVGLCLSSPLRGLCLCTAGLILIEGGQVPFAMMICLAAFNWLADMQQVRSHSEGFDQGPRSAKLKLEQCIKSHYDRFCEHMGEVCGEGKIVGPMVLVVLGQVSVIFAYIFGSWKHLSIIGAILGLATAYHASSEHHNQPRSAAEFLKFAFFPALLLLTWPVAFAFYSLMLHFAFCVSVYAVLPATFVLIAYVWIAWVFNYWHMH